MKPKDKIILTLVIGILSLLGALVIGEVFMSHQQGNDVSPEVVTLLKMSITGLIGIIAGYMGGKQKEDK